MTEPNIRLIRGTSWGIEYPALRGAIEWAQRTVKVFGRVHPQPRLTRWYGDAPYTYSNLTWEASPMPALVAALRDQVEALTSETFNSVLCNLYRDGSDTVSWHSDDEPVFGGDPVVASLSFGVTRGFQVKRRDGSGGRTYLLENGSLLVMGRGVQPEWLHRVPRSKAVTGERLNLTFRRTV